MATHELHKSGLVPALPWAPLLGPRKVLRPRTDLKAMGDLVPLPPCCDSSTPTLVQAPGPGTHRAFCLSSSSSWLTQCHRVPDHTEPVLSLNLGF